MRLKTSQKTLFTYTALAAALLTAAYAAAYLGPYLPVREAPAGITDMHCHIAGIGAGGSGALVSARLRRSPRFALYLRAFGVTAAELEKKGDWLIPARVSELAKKSRSVGKVVILALDGAVGPDGELDAARTEVYVPNEFAAAAAARYPNLLFGASVNPYRRDALPRLRRAKEQGAVLIKWIPSVMELNPADPALAPFYRELARLGLPLLTHSGHERSFSASRDELGDPERLRLPLKFGVTVIAPHIASTGLYGGERSSDRLARLMTEFPNLYSDISSLTQANKPRYLEEALKRPEFSGRLMYGSDFPLINTPLISPARYFRRIPPWTLLKIIFTRNPLDRDVLLKQHLGVPPEVFALSGKLIN
ncbi:MAG: amidohydrolase family protein [Elusimicrobiales bacterium]|nr:amidohydrolase family protein [Elusimicrobiales bacterium]